MAEPAPDSGFDAVLRRMFDRTGIETLPAHLEEAHGLRVRKFTQLDVGVFRVDRADGAPPVVARLFSATRPHEAAAGDLAVLRYLAEVGFRAERPFGGESLTVHEGQSVLVTEFVRQVPKSDRPKGSVIRLGAMVGRLHGLPVPPGADRPAGALHHFAEGTMADEIRAARSWLDSVAAGASAEIGDALHLLRAELDTADGGDGLPEAFVHPDPVPKNAVFTADGPVLIDWTSAGRGPRLASMTLLLRSGWAAAPFMNGYARRITLTDEERARLPGPLLSRRLIMTAFNVCRDPSTAAAAARKLKSFRDESETKAQAILGILGS